MGRAAWALGLLAMLCATLAGCASFGPLSAELSGKLAATAAPLAPSRRRAQIDMQGQGFFEAVLVTDGTGTRARLQLLPEVGGKLLDLAITPERIAGYMPPAGISLLHLRDAHQAPPRHLLAFVAASVLEVVSPLTPERVRGERAVQGGSELALHPVLEGLEVTARVDAAGRLLSREYRLRGVRWSELVDGDVRTFEGRGLHWTVHEGAAEPIATPAASLFELDLPSEPAVEPGAPLP